ncbi:MAG: PhzF family phenazine biosynthesis protein, partial [Chloroflexi bacterium]|nr:PhzF family phenazine biosynthesis protein [Chloroflexota bacterium]
MKIPIYQVDAFTDEPFSGNPTAVCPLAAGRHTPGRSADFKAR